MLIHWIWLATRPALSHRQKLAMLHAFSDAEDVFFAARDSYRNVEGITQEGIEALADKDLTQAEKILDDCVRENIQICTYTDVMYPARLKNISDPPLLLYYRGNLMSLDTQPVIAVVGTRKASAYGMTTASRMGYQIARCGGILVSGLAEGIDGSAMKGALTAGGSIIGVLGCGVDIVYPAMHRSLYRDTERNGCLISEYPPGTRPFSWNFPRRNRIMSGLSNGILVVEAPYQSGSLITARLALDQGRDVFVVPGNIDVETCQGSNALLRDGAIAVSSGWDVVSEYAHLYPDKVLRDSTAPKQIIPQERGNVLRVAQKTAFSRKKEASDKKTEEKPVDNAEKQSYSNRQELFDSLSEQERGLLEPLKQGEASVDDLIAASGLPTGKVLAMLTMLQIRGVVRLLPGKRIALK